MSPTTSTYVYCIVAARSAPDTSRAPSGLAGLAAPRVLEVHRGLFAIVANAPRGRYSQAAISRGLSQLTWVSRAAVAHEAVVEHFMDERAVLPMKLFTIFATDERAVEHLRSKRSQLSATARRVSGQLEWGVRVLLDRSRALAEQEAQQTSTRRDTRRRSGGTAYLVAKQARRNAAAELSTRAKATAAELFTRLARKARAARKRPASDLTDRQGMLLLDAAFLVPKSRVAEFRSAAAREAKALAPRGYNVALTGPWPPYTFVQD